MIKQPDENGISNCDCDGAHFIIVHDNVSLFFKGQHAGRISTGPGKTIEYFDTEFDMEDRITFLDLDESGL